MELGLEGKVAIVTGGARGIGGAIVEGFVKEGSSVVISDILLDAANELAEGLKQGGTRALAVGTDVRKKRDVDNLVETTLKEFGKIDILVNAAGVISDVMFVDLDEEEWDRVLDINAKGVYLVTRAVIPHMIAAKQGKIITISSRSGKNAQAGLAHYGASKFAVIGITQALAKELAEYNINVNAVCPGILRTAMWEKILDDRSKRAGIPREEIFAKMTEAIPLGRAQTLDDVANMVLYLSSEVARNITGEAININGGILMD